MSTIHTFEVFYENSDGCPHPLPEECEFPCAEHDNYCPFDEWHDNHHGYEHGYICMDMPVGLHCVDCSEYEGDSIPSQYCRLLVNPCGHMDCYDDECIEDD